MQEINVAILGCGTVGGGTATILLNQKSEIFNQTGCQIHLKKIVDLNPSVAAGKHNIERSLFCGQDDELSSEQANQLIDEILKDPSIDLIVETIGGSHPFILDLVLRIIKAGKHLVTANKALLAEYHHQIFQSIQDNEVAIGFEGAVCGAIPIIKSITEYFIQEEVFSFSGILNGTSNYILSQMTDKQISFEEALKQAQEAGYAEADPTLDISGGDAGHKLVILLRLIYGLDIRYSDLAVQGIEQITQEEIDFAGEIDCKLKLICF
ncbi:MAG: homoserine dehydrogenase, partial [Spirochaetes bacterium]|nr:homoserine dehydrogenase [Spirochaetota bacterium]